MAEYIKIEDIKKQQRKDKVNNFFKGLQDKAKKVSSAVGETTAKGVEKYKEYQAKAPEREKARIERLKKEEQRLLSVNKERKLRERVQKLRGSVYGTGSSNPFVANPFAVAPVSRPVVKKKSTSPRYAIIKGKAYRLADSKPSRKKARSSPKPREFNPFAF